MIFAINTTSDISKLLHAISRAVRQVKFVTSLKYHEWYLCQISRTSHAIICLYYYPQKFVIFTCRYFKLSGNTTALSQSNCRNLSGSSIIIIISVIYYQKYVILTCNIHRSRVAPRDCSQLHAKSKSTKPQPLHLPPPPPPKKKILHHHSL